MAIIRNARCYANLCQAQGMGSLYILLVRRLLINKITTDFAFCYIIEVTTSDIGARSFT